MGTPRLHYLRRLSPMRPIILGIFAAILLLPGIARTQSCPEWHVTVEQFEGSPQVQNAAADTRWRPVKLHDVYCKGDKLKVDKDSEVHLKLFGDVAGGGGIITISDTGNKIWTVNSQDIVSARQAEQINGPKINVGSLTAIIFVGLVILLIAFNFFGVSQKFLRLIEYIGNVDLSRKAK